MINVDIELPKKIFNAVERSRKTGQSLNDRIVELVLKGISMHTNQPPKKVGGEKMQPMEPQYKTLEESLRDVENKLADKEIIWDHPKCSQCEGILTHYSMEADKAVCQKCGNVYEMKYLGNERR